MKNQIAEQSDWQAEDDLRTLMRAEEIRKDAERLARANARAAEQKRALSKISGKAAAESEDSVMSRGYRKLS